eukprot:TRINITY_DN10123_c0_g1_i5.p1 TRINITY_DN10123_c0_g1~~TRINITY_DN10123_c0_g1_i5.p1  ORF type:complete len:315 (+),score=56.67 TRINITY_DN10123_c0_g1_i5:1120-2064(+)
MAEKSRKSKFMGGLKAVGGTIKRSPQVMRRKIGGLKKRMGGGRQHSDLASCKENGWLHTDEKIHSGVSYKITYLGSMEIGFVPGDANKNNDMAMEVIRKITRLNVAHDNLIMTIAAERMLLERANNQVIMRHSTCRIAYSTVDHSEPCHFAYVALPRKSNIALCHVFKTKNPKMSYEMTFTCAQAFDANYRAWQENADVQKAKAIVSEQSDVETVKAVPSPALHRKPIAASAAPAQEEDDEEDDEEGSYMDLPPVDQPGAGEIGRHDTVEGAASNGPCRALRPSQDRCPSRTCPLSMMTCVHASRYAQTRCRRR